MKKTLFFMIILAVLATGCKKDKSKSLNYNDSNPIEMVHQGEYDIYRQINVTSDYDITFKSLNESVLTVTSDGKMKSKTVGTGKVNIDNGYEDMTVDVNVRLFREPSFEFGCNINRIKNLFGAPFDEGTLPDADTVYCLQYTQTPGCHGNYSYACGEMDFFFYEGAYYEADVYIRHSTEYLLNNYLTENFNYHSTIGDTLDLYKYKLDTTIICGKFDSHNQWDEFCLFYIQENQTSPEKSVASFLNRRPRSSKLRY